MPAIGSCHVRSYGLAVQAPDVSVTGVTVWAILAKYRFELPHHPSSSKSHSPMPPIVGRGVTLVESMSFERRVACSNPALAATLGPIGQVLHLQLPVALRRVNSDTVSIAVVGSAPERCML